MFRIRSIRPRMTKQLLAVFTLLIVLSSLGSPIANAASCEVARSIPYDRYRTHNLVYINYDTVNRRYRAHCISVGNNAVSRFIKACRLYYYDTWPQHTAPSYVRGSGNGGPGGGPYHVQSGLVYAHVGRCYYAQMWVTFPGRDNAGRTLSTPTIC
jgi:hypothetical protein